MYAWRAIFSIDFHFLGIFIKEEKFCRFIYLTGSSIDWIDRRNVNSFLCSSYSVSRRNGNRKYKKMKKKANKVNVVFIDTEDGGILKTKVMKKCHLI